jgi:CBS domain-containing protein
MLVREVMTSPAVTVVPTASLKQAMRLLDEHEITAMPVVDTAGHLVGVLSEADVLREAVQLDRLAHAHLVEITAPPVHLTVTDVMTHMPVSVSPDEDVAEAVGLLVDTQMKSLPVVQFGLVVGMVSRRDVIAVLARQDDLIEAEVDEALRLGGVECTVEVHEGVVHLHDAQDHEATKSAQVIAAGVPGVVAVSVGVPR